MPVFTEKRVSNSFGFSERVYLLLFRGAPVAFLYRFASQSKFYAFQTGYDSNMEAYSPGDIVFQMVYEHLVGEQMKELTYLRGGESYKDQFGDMPPSRRRAR